MISRVNSSAAQSIYAKNASENKVKENIGTENAKEGSKVEQLKALINAGEYKVDLSSLSQKMADELL